MIDNPWVDLRQDDGRYIAPCDVDFLDDTTVRKYNLRLDAFPEPFIGNPDTAEVVLLGLNPGFIESDVDFNFGNQDWVSLARQNLTHSTDFFYLKGSLRDTGGFKWWRRRLRTLHESGIKWERLSRKIVAVEYFPYHSIHYNIDNNFLLPSQEYSFHLVRQAIQRNKIIILMRSEALWLRAVPELQDYSYIKLDSPQSTYITPGNMNGVLNDRESDYNKILQAVQT